MNHAVKYFCEHKTKIRSHETTARIELLEDGFVGDPVELKGDPGQGVYDRDIQGLDTEDPLAQPIKKTQLDFYVRIHNESELQILQDIFEAEEGTYQLRLKINGSVKCTVKVLMDMLEVPESSYPFTATITGKDLILSGENFDLVTGRETIIETIAGILSQADFDLSIFTHSSWVVNEFDDDILNVVYNERKAFRLFGSDTDSEITLESALHNICKNYCMILMQSNNAWRFYQLTELKDAETGVKRYEYNSSGVKQGETTVNDIKQVDRDSLFALPNSMNRKNPPLKQVEVSFDHRTKIEGLGDLPSSIQGGTEFQDYFESNGNQSIVITADMTVVSNGNAGDVSGRVRIQALGLYYDMATNSWVGGVTNNAFSVRQTADTRYSGSFEIGTDDIPIGRNDITITFLDFTFTGDPGSILSASYDNATYEVLVLQRSRGTADPIRYAMRRDVASSVLYDHGPVWFGNGPDRNSPSALTLDASGISYTIGWKRRGEEEDRPFFDNVLYELLDPRRNGTENLRLNLWGDYEPDDLLQYDGKILFFLGGRQTGTENKWDAYFLKVDVVHEDETSFQITDNTFANLSEALVGIEAREEEQRQFIQTLIGGTMAIGRTAENLDGTYTSFLGRLRVAMRVGFDYYIFNESEFNEPWFGLYTITITGETGGDTGSGLVIVDIEEQVINAPSGSFIIEVPGQREIIQNLTEIRIQEGQDAIFDLETVQIPALEDALDDLNTIVIPGLENEIDNLENVQIPNLQDQLDNLNTVVIPGLENEIDILETVTIPGLQDNLDDLDSELTNLDNILGNPPDSATFFESIVTNTAWLNEFVANLGYIDQLVVSTSWQDTVIANNAYMEKIVSSTGFFNEFQAVDGYISDLVVNNSWQNTVTANTAFMEKVVASTGFFNEFQAVDGFVDELISNGAWIGKVVTNMLGAEVVTADKIDVDDLFAQDATIAGELVVVGTLRNSSPQTYNIDADSFEIYEGTDSTPYGILFKAGPALTGYVRSISGDIKIHSVDDMTISSGSGEIEIRTFSDDLSLIGPGGTFRINQSGGVVLFDSAINSGLIDIDGDVTIETQGSNDIHLDSAARVDIDGSLIDMNSTGNLETEFNGDELDYFAAQSHSTTAGSQAGFVTVLINGAARRIKAYTIP